MGAGKSTALQLLGELGAAVLSTDAVVHELYGQQDLRDAMTARWGPEVAPAGMVDRAAIAQRAFASEQERRWLEETLWPLVGARVAAWLAEVRGQAQPTRPRAAVVEVPLLFEAGMEDLYDATIAVVSAEDIRRGRAGERGHVRVDERTGRQLPQEEKARRATFVVRNDGTREELGRELSAVLDKLAT
jgi:dephospho-CoA kinase